MIYSRDHKLFDGEDYKSEDIEKNVKTSSNYMGSDCDATNLAG